MELDLILPLMMKIGNVTRTHHCHFTTLVYAFTFLLKVAVEASCSVNCSTFASARVHFKRCHTNDTEMNREARKQIFLLSPSLSLFVAKIVLCYCILCFVNVSSASPLICAPLLFQLIQPTKKPLTCFTNYKIGNPSHSFHSALNGICTFHTQHTKCAHFCSHNFISLCSLAHAIHSS